MESGTKMSGQAARRTLAVGVLFKIIVIVLGNLFLGVTANSDVTGIWIRYIPSLVADVVIGGLYVFMHLQQMSDLSIRADVGAKGGFISSLAIHAITGVLAIFFGLCGTITTLGDPTYQEGLTTVAAGLMNLWFSEYRIVLTSQGTIVLIGAMLSAISGALCAALCMHLGTLKK